MNVWLTSLLLLMFLFLSAVFSGSETGAYSLSRIRLEAEAHAGRRSAQLLRRLTRNDIGFLITLLIGNNLMLELLTHVFERELLPDFPPGARELAVTVVLTPIVFLFAELLPKDLFRRRPHRFLGLAGPILVAARALLLPLALPIQGLSFLLERLFGLKGRTASRLFRREEMIEVLEESARTGALPPAAQALARNVLVLRETPVDRVMVPWERVRLVDFDRPEPESRETIENASFTRLPAIETTAGAAAANVIGYVHQLDVLGQEKLGRDCVRELPRIASGTPVDRALNRLRLSGQRLALVGTSEEPVGLVTLMDLVDAISRESSAS